MFLFLYICQILLTKSTISIYIHEDETVSNTTDHYNFQVFMFSTLISNFINIEKFINNESNFIDIKSSFEKLLTNFKSKILNYYIYFEQENAINSATKFFLLLLTLKDEILQGAINYLNLFPYLKYDNKYITYMCIKMIVKCILYEKKVECPSLDDIYKFLVCLVVHKIASQNALTKNVYYIHYTSNINVSDVNQIHTSFVPEFVFYTIPFTVYNIDAEEKREEFCRYINLQFYIINVFNLHLRDIKSAKFKIFLKHIESIVDYLMKETFLQVQEMKEKTLFIYRIKMDKDIGLIDIKTYSKSFINFTVIDEVLAIIDDFQFYLYVYIKKNQLKEKIGDLFVNKDLKKIKKKCMEEIKNKLKWKIFHERCKNFINR